MKIKRVISLTVTENVIELCEHVEGIDATNPVPLKIIHSCIGHHDVERIGAAFAPFLNFAREFGANEKNGDYQLDQVGGFWFRKMRWTPTKRINLIKAKKYLAVLKPLEIVVELDTREGLRLPGSRIEREAILKYLSANGGDEGDRKALRQIALRKRDPLANEAQKLLASWGEEIVRL